MIGLLIRVRAVSVATASLAIASIVVCSTVSAATITPGVIPHPQIESYGQGAIKIAEKSNGVFVSLKGIHLTEFVALTAGTRLLVKRFDQLGACPLAIANSQTAQIVIEKHVLTKG